jgi:IclR family transcriptional regulator, blcABC operon repressor
MNNTLPHEPMSTAQPVALDKILPKGTVPSVIKAVQILDTLADSRDPMTLAELTGRLLLPKSSVLALCTSLARTGLVHRLDNGSYQLGTHLVDLAHAYLSNIDLTKEFALTWDALAMLPGEGVVLAVQDGRDVVYIACRNGNLPLGVTYRIGMRLPSNCTATGKALLATLPDEQVRALYRGAPLQQLTANSHKTLKALLADLNSVRQQGYAIDDEEVREGMRCIGAPVFDSSGSHAIAAVAVSTVKRPDDEQREHQAVRAVLEFSRVLSKRLGATALNTGKLP